VTIATAQEMARHRDETEAMMQRYPSIRRPIFMVVGSDDKASVLAGAHRFVMQVPQSKLTVLERAGHMLPFTRVDALSKVVDMAEN
jgi:pimeloyl-ACP methyl ester carboxylesterase